MTKTIDLSLSIQFKDFADLENVVTTLQQLGENVHVTIFGNVEGREVIIK